MSFAPFLVILARESSSTSFYALLQPLVESDDGKAGSASAVVARFITYLRVSDSSGMIMTEWPLQRHNIIFHFKKQDIVQQE
jgi:hypothetical protein